MTITHILQLRHQVYSLKVEIIKKMKYKLTDKDSKKTCLNQCLPLKRSHSPLPNMKFKFNRNKSNQFAIMLQQ